MTLIDLLQRPFLDEKQIGWVIERQQEAFKVMLAGGRFVAATRIVEYLREQANSKEQIKPVREAAERCLDGLREPQTLSGIVDVLGEVKSSDIGLVHNLIDLLGPTAIHQLLCVLGEEGELSRRRHIFDLLASLGSAVVPASIGLLEDQRWYMIRNILSLLRRVGEGLSLEVLQKGLAHEDSRVRIEAVKCMPELGAEVTPAMVEEVLADQDSRVAEMAIGVFGSARIAAAVQPMVELLKKPDRLGRQRRLRLRALQALGEFGDAKILNQIAPFFRSWFAPVSVEERHAAYQSLRLYPEADRRSWLKKGRWSLDPEIREICRALIGAESPAAGV
jgi:HEAT repeat protein